MDKFNGKRLLSSSVLYKLLLPSFVLAQASWESEYVGNSARLFVALIKKAHGELTGEQFKILSKTLRNQKPILQSSGVGKSRLVDEAGKYVFTIPMCLRKIDTIGELAEALHLIFSSFTQPNNFRSPVPKY